MTLEVALIGLVGAAWVLWDRIAGLRQRQLIQEPLQRNLAWAADRLRIQGVESNQADGRLVWDEDGPCEMVVRHVPSGEGTAPWVTTLRLPCAQPFKLTDHRAQRNALLRRITGQDLLLGDPAFDERWRVQGPELTTRLIWGRKARVALMLATPRVVDSDGSQMELQWREQRLPTRELIWRRLRRSRELRQGLEAGTWEQQAQALTLRAEATDRMSGVLDGFPVTVHADAQGTRITVTVPSQVLAIHKGWKTPRLWIVQPTGNPVVDGLIKMGGDPDAVRRVVAGEAVESLLQVVHGWPGSTLHPEGVTLLSPTLLTDELPGALTAALQLAKRLP